MKAVIYNSKNDFRLEDFSKPILNKNEALLKVKAAGICGTDYIIWSGKHPRIKKNIIVGHEVAGEIVDINAEDGWNDFKKGDRASVIPIISCGKCYACKNGFYHVCKNLKVLGIDINGCFAEYLKAPLENIIKLRNNVSYENIAIIEPLAVAVHAIMRSNFKIGDSVIIIGGGPIGILIAMLLRASGASLIVISDINPFRIKRIKELGFNFIDGRENNIIEFVDEFTMGEGFNILFEVAGDCTSSSKLINYVKIKGEIIIVGMFKDKAMFDFWNLNYKEVNIKGVRVYTRSDFIRSKRILESEKIDVRKLITHKIKLESIQDCMSVFEGNNDFLKILVTP